MNDVTTTEEQLERLSCFVYGGFYDEYEYNAAKELFVQIRKQLLSEALEESYKNGFNDGQAEGLPEALRAERERMFSELEKLKASTDMGDIIPWCDVEKLRITQQEQP